MGSNVNPVHLWHHLAGTPPTHEPEQWDARVPERFSPYTGGFHGVWTNFGNNYQGEDLAFGNNTYAVGCEFDPIPACTIGGPGPGGTIKDPNNNAYFGNGRHIVGRWLQDFHKDHQWDGEESEFVSAPVPRFYPPGMLSWNRWSELWERFTSCPYPGCNGNFVRPQLGQYTGFPLDELGAQGANTMCKLRGNKLWMFVTAGMGSCDSHKIVEDNWSAYYGFSIWVADIRETDANQFGSPGEKFEAGVECASNEIIFGGLSPVANTQHNYGVGGSGNPMPKQPYVASNCWAVGEELSVNIMLGHHNQDWWGDRRVIRAIVCNPYTGEVRWGESDFGRTTWQTKDIAYPHKIAERDAPHCAGYDVNGLKIMLGQFSLSYAGDGEFAPETCLMDRDSESILLDTPTLGPTPNYGYTIRAYDRIPANSRWASKDMVIWQDGLLLGNGSNVIETVGKLFHATSGPNLLNCGVTIRTETKDNVVEDDTLNLFDYGENTVAGQWCPVGGCLTPYGDPIILMLSGWDLMNDAATTGPIHPETGEQLYGEHWRLIRPGHWDIVWRKPPGAGILYENNYWGGFSVGFIGVSRAGSPVETHPGWINSPPFAETDTADPLRNPYEDFCDDQAINAGVEWGNATFLEGPRVVANEKWVSLLCCPSRVTPSTHLALGHTYPSFMSHQKGYETREWEDTELESANEGFMLPVPARLRNNVWFDWLVDLETAEIRVPWRHAHSGVGAGQTGWKHEGQRSDMSVARPQLHSGRNGYDLVHLNTAHAAAEPESNIGSMPPRCFH